MFKYTFEGDILPHTQSFPDLTLNQKIGVPEIKLEYKMVVIVKNFQVHIVVTTESEITDFLTLRNTVKDALFMITNFHDYLEGCYHDIQITSYKDEQTGQIIPLNTSIGKISEKDDRPKIDLGIYYRLLGKKTEYNFLRFAIHDLSLAIKYPKDTVFFCFRAVESLKSFFDDNKPKAWNAFYQNLNVSPSLKQKLENYAKTTRHGSPILLVSEEREKIMKNTWKVVDRFMIYAMNGEISLDKTKYPELKFE